MIAVLDYNMGNLANVCRVLTELGGNPKLVSEPGPLKKATGVVLPGVGAFGEAVDNLRERKLFEPLKNWDPDAPPLLGICLGMQLLLSSSTEFGRHEGLGLVPGQVVRLPKGVKAPHMGWNQLHIAQRHALLKGVREGAYVYFVHSYYAKPKNGADVVATTDYGRDLTAIVGRANVAGMQFHPEKSQQVGHRMLSNFVAWTKR